MLRLKSLQPILYEKAEAIAFGIHGQVEIADIDGNILARIEGPEGSDDRFVDSYALPVIYHGVMIGELRAHIQQAASYNTSREMIRKYLHQMASLLACLASELAAAQREDELLAILETVHEGALVINTAGIVTYCNSVARSLLKREEKNLLGVYIEEFWPDAAALKSMNAGKEFTEREEMCFKGKERLHFIVTLRLIREDREIAGAVISFRDIVEARRLIYQMNESRISYTFEDIAGCSKALEQVKEKAMQVTGSSSTVLISGETGVGKEVFARAIHFSGPRKNGPFINVNCGAIPENLLESELFGYEGGAFTGALKGGKAGKFELASSGTIFLDEIGEMPLSLQVKLLHVLQNREVERVGGTKKIPVDIRIIAASNRDLEAMMEEKEFRKDLYFRLGVIPLHIPPLRERKEDIPLLTEHCMIKFAQKLSRKKIKISPEAMECMIRYQWPGNIREMENAIEYAMNMCKGDVIKVCNLPSRLQAGLDDEEILGKAPLEELVQDFERKILMQYIDKYGNTLQAKQEIAKMLGISRATLYRKLAGIGIK